MPLHTSGALYIVNLESRAVEGVAQLHSGALAALAVHNGFCVTGSADRLLRVWGSDLQQVYLEAQHEGPVTGGWAGTCCGCAACTQPRSFWGRQPHYKLNE